MVRRKIMGLFICTLILGMAAFASASVPDLDKTTASMAYGGADVVSVFCLPNTGGNAFTTAYEADGTIVDATITLTVLDFGYAAIVNFPSEDMWLASAGMNACVGGAIADRSTDEFGVTVWAAALAAGGFSTGASTQVIISGDALTSSAGLGLIFNSADTNGDGSVNLSDVGNFSTDFFGAYNYRSDFVRNGAIDLSDVGRMAVGMGASCP